VKSWEIVRALLMLLYSINLFLKRYGYRFYSRIAVLKCML